MCLILFAYRAHPRYTLVVAANRDEWFRRPTAPAGLWSDRPEVFAGRDLEQGGTWFGVSRSGRFSALTNFREPSAHRDDAPSRGKLVSDFLVGRVATAGYLASLAAAGARYNGFSLLAWDGTALGYYSNRESNARDLAPGVYGLSNHLLETPWPKVRHGRARLAELLEREFTPEDLLAMLDNTAAAPDEELPHTGVGLEWERKLSPMRILAGEYGTRCSTALRIGDDGVVEFAERSYDASGGVTGTVAERFTVERLRRARAPS